MGSVQHRQQGWPGWVAPLHDTTQPELLPLPADPDEQKRACEAAKALLGTRPDLAKLAGAFDGGGFDAGPPIDKDLFGQVVWSPVDPFTTPSMRAAATGLVETAAMAQGGRPLVPVGQVAGIAGRMAGGVAAGWLVGKTLSALAGLSQPAQQSLQRVGLWTGVLNSVVPLAFGG
jgi:hypothetical protein